MAKIYFILIFGLILLMNNPSYSLLKFVYMYSDTNEVETPTTEEETEVEVIEEDDESSLQDTILNQKTNDDTIQNHIPSSIEDVNGDEDRESLNDKYITISPSISYKSKQMKNGLDLSNGKPSLTEGINISHYWGISVDLSRSNIFAKKLPYLNTDFGISYEYSFNDYFSTDLNYTKSFYPTEETNVIATTPNALSLAFDFSLPNIIFDLSYSRKFGTNQINELSFSIISYFKLTENFKITPIASITGSDYNIKLKKVNKTFTGKAISSISLSCKLGYSIWNNLQISLNPTFAYTPDKNFNVKSYQTYFNIGLDYDFDISL